MLRPSSFLLMRESTLSVFDQDLPLEVNHDALSIFFPAYGEVLSIDHCHFAEYPSVHNGNWLVKILLTQDIAYFEVEDCNC